MSQLIRYEAARTALAECQRVDEVKDIRDKAEAMAAYARQAKDQEMIMWATEIKVRAERKCGELLAQAEKNHGARLSGRDEFGNVRRSNDATTEAPTLSDMGITKDQSSRYQQLAAMPDDNFETAVATAKDTAGQVTSAFMLRQAKAARPHGKPKTGAKADAMREQLRTVTNASMLCRYAKIIIAAIDAGQEFSHEEQQALSSLHAAIGRLPMTTGESQQ